ncbi:MAG: hypothetical protein JXA03_09170, partial [Bacteroidales bacterium]|nr:hypothetical protein [Bacteroidales bacterium]
DFLLGFSLDGSRNTSLFNCAKETGSKGVERDIAKQLCKRGAELCGLDAQETITTFSSGYDTGFTDTEENIDIKNNDGSTKAFSNSIQITHPKTGELLTTEKWFAERIAELFCDKIRFNQTSGKFLIYDGKKWLNDEHGKIFEYAEYTLKLIRKKTKNFEGDRGKLVRALLKFEKLQIFRGALGYLEQLSDIRKTENDFDVQCSLLNCQNGTLDLLNREFKPHNSSEHLSKISEASFEPSAKCPRWENFLKTIFQADTEQILFIQKAVGLSLLGEVKEQCLFFCYGSGANGKSVFSETIRHLFGNYYQKAPAEMLMARDYKQQNTNDIARLKGVRFVIASELQDGQRFNEAFLKDLTGGDKIAARFLYKEFFEFTPSHTLWIYGNHQPIIRGTDEGIWRRIRLIPFTYQIPSEKRIPLPDLVASFVEELPGILNWALDGLDAYRQEGLTDCKAVRDATAIYRKDSDSLGTFLSECTELDKSSETKQSELYETYHNWCERTGEYPINSRRFCAMMRERGFSDRSGSQGMKIWRGISLSTF